MCLAFKRFDWKWWILLLIENQRRSTKRSRRGLPSPKFPSWPTISLTTSLSSSQPCSYPRGSQRGRRRVWPYSLATQSYHQITGSCLSTYDDKDEVFFFWVDDVCSKEWFRWRGWSSADLPTCRVACATVWTSKSSFGLQHTLWNPLIGVLERPKKV